MRRETSLWLEQARKDFEVAEKNLNIDEYYVTAFFCRQAVEKALKAHYIEKLKESPGTTHSLVFLASETKCLRDFLNFLSC
jgi:HEPN domain-containing protein